MTESSLDIFHLNFFEKFIFHSEDGFLFNKNEVWKIKSTHPRSIFVWGRKLNLQESNLHPEDLRISLMWRNKKLKGFSVSKQQREKKKLNVVYFHQVLGASWNFSKTKRVCVKRGILIPEYEIFWIYLVWGCISSDATNLHKIYKSRKETFILLKGRESDQI